MQKAAASKGYFEGSLDCCVLEAVLPMNVCVLQVDNGDVRQVEAIHIDNLMDLHFNTKDTVEHTNMRN